MPRKDPLPANETWEIDSPFLSEEFFSERQEEGDLYSFALGMESPFQRFSTEVPLIDRSDQDADEVSEDISDSEVDDSKEAPYDVMRMFDRQETLDELGSFLDLSNEIKDALNRKEWVLALRLAIQTRWRDENALTDLIFFTRHPELPNDKLNLKDPKYKSFNDEWRKILKSEVRPAIQNVSTDTNLSVSGEYVVERDPLFSGEAGKKLKELVEWAAREVDINPGLLAAVLFAEWDKRSLYLSAGEVWSYDESGTDDFYTQIEQLRANVPATSKISYDENRKKTVSNEKGREVINIPYKSGRDAALATAVYLKYGEIKLRRAAQKNGGDFYGLPIETQFALVRIAMNAGHGGIDPDGRLNRYKKVFSKKKKKYVYIRVKPGEKGGVFIGVAERLDRVLNGEDILVRRNEPRKYPKTKHIANRNATILAAQAMHLSNWFFGNKLVTPTPQEIEESEGWDDVQEDRYDIDSYFAGRSAEGRDAALSGSLAFGYNELLEHKTKDTDEIYPADEQLEDEVVAYTCVQDDDESRAGLSEVFFRRTMEEEPEPTFLDELSESMALYRKESFERESEEDLDEHQTPVAGAASTCYEVISLSSRRLPAIGFEFDLNYGASTVRPPLARPDYATVYSLEGNR